jgi:hypothetical protein
VIGKRQAGQAVVHAAAGIGAFCAARVPGPCTAATLPVLSADSKGIVMRPGALRAATAKERRPPGEDADPADGRGETQPQADGGPGRRLRRRACPAPPARRDRPARRPARIPGTAEGPRARAKWLSGLVRHDPADVIAAAFDEAEARDPQHLRTWVVLAGGAEHQLGLIRAEAARRGVAIHIAIDLIHVFDLSTVSAYESHISAGHIVVEIDVTLLRR